MLTATQRMRQAEQMLDNLCEQQNDIPGNFRAKQRRTKHDDSKLVFPIPRRKEPETYKTHYTLHFNNKPKARPSSPRPCSPTRRNNPHPSMNFLNWRIPTRAFDYGREKQANMSFLKSNIKDTYQTFYDDYAGEKRRNGEVNPKMLLELVKSYDSASQKRERKRRGVVLSPLKGDDRNSGITLPTLLRRSRTPDLASFGIPRTLKGKKHGKISPLLHNKDEDFKPLFQSWYDAASKDKGVMDKAREKAEEQYIQDALAQALKPDAIAAIENWLLNADDEEREIAVQFIKAIILASIQDSSPRKTKKTPIPADGANKHHNHYMKKECENCQKRQLESDLQQLQSMATQPREVPAITELLNPLHPEVLEKKQRRRVSGEVTRKLHRPRNNPNKGSLFVTSKKPKGRHFTIHPEWH